MSDVSDNLDEFLAIVTRDLGAREAHVYTEGAEPAADERTLRCALADGRVVVASFDEMPTDVEARRRRLEMLASAFADILPHEARARGSRPPPARSLHEELAALAQRVGAIEAVVIDAHSPVVWGWASEEEARGERDPDAPPISTGTPLSTGGLHAVGPEDEAAQRYGMASAQGMRVDPAAVALLPAVVRARHRVLPIALSEGRLVLAMADPDDADAVHDVVLATGLEVDPIFAGESMAAFFAHADAGEPGAWDAILAAIPEGEREAREAKARRAKELWTRRMLVRRAVTEVRALPEMVALKKGGHVRHTSRGEDFGCVARSFAAIYVLVLVFDRAFDELTAKRALTHALPIIERLVAALPPLDPGPPVAGAAAMRVRRRR